MISGTSERIPTWSPPTRKPKVKRLLALLAYEKITDYSPAQEVLARELARQNRTVCRTTGLSPDQACAKALHEQRNVLHPCAPRRRLPTTKCRLLVAHARQSVRGRGRKPQRAGQRRCCRLDGPGCATCASRRGRAERPTMAALAPAGWPARAGPGFGASTRSRLGGEFGADGQELQAELLELALRRHIVVAEETRIDLQTLQRGDVSPIHVITVTEDKDARIRVVCRRV